MWKIALKQILAHRKSNIWLLVELFLVAIVLWYCVDFISVMTYKRWEPTGTDTDHVYEMRMGVSPNAVFTKEMADSLDHYWVAPQLQIQKMLAQHPDIEVAGSYMGTHPYAGRSYMAQGYTIDQEKMVSAPIRYVSKEYFEVMKIELLSGSAEPWNFEFPQRAIISPELADSLFHRRDVIGEKFSDYYTDGLDYIVSGICPSTKFDYYAEYGPFIYTPLLEAHLRFGLVKYVFRVKEEKDYKGFEREFFDEVRQQLEIGSLYLYDIKPMDAYRDYYLTDIKVPKYLGFAKGLLLFFMLTVFLGVSGSYWFMVERRRSEVGIRMAIGAGREGVLAFFTRESLLLLAMAYVPALLVMALLAYFEITYTFQDCMPYTWGRFWITQAITLGLIVIVVLLGVRLPARRASKIEPAAILNEE